MSKRGASTRERRIDAIIDHIREPAFRAYEVPGAMFIVEPTRARMSAPDMSAKALTTDVVFHERFTDKSLAMFVRDRKNAEAILNAIQKIGAK